MVLLALLTGICLATNAAAGDLPDMSSRQVTPQIIVEEAPVEIVEPPLFLNLPELKTVYAAVDVPYHLFWVGESYFLNDGDSWYKAASCGGPWIEVNEDLLPKDLRRFPVEELTYMRDMEYRHYEDKGSRYRGRVFRPVIKK